MMLYPLAIITLIVPFISTSGMEVAILSLYTLLTALAQIHYGVCLVSLYRKQCPILLQVVVFSQGML